MRQIEVCLKAGSKAMDPGGVRTVLLNGIAQNIVVADTIEEYCNSVECLDELLSPKTAYKKNEIKEFLDKYYMATEELNLFERANHKILNELSLNREAIRNGQFKDTLNNYNKDFCLKKVKCYRKLFRALMNLAEQSNYFDEESV